MIAPRGCFRRQASKGSDILAIGLSSLQSIQGAGREAHEGQESGERQRFEDGKKMGPVRSGSIEFAQVSDGTSRFSGSEPIWFHSGQIDHIHENLLWAHGTNEVHHRRERIGFSSKLGPKGLGTVDTPTDESRSHGLLTR